MEWNLIGVYCPNYRHLLIIGICQIKKRKRQEIKLAECMPCIIGFPSDPSCLWPKLSMHVHLDGFFQMIKLALWSCIIRSVCVCVFLYVCVYLYVSLAFICVCFAMYMHLQHGILCCILCRSVHADSYIDIKHGVFILIFQSLHINLSTSVSSAIYRIPAAASPVMVKTYKSTGCKGGRT